MDIRVGIDLGTNFSAVAFIDEQTVKANPAKNYFCSHITPSILYFEPNWKILYDDTKGSLLRVKRMKIERFIDMVVSMTFQLMNYRKRMVYSWIITVI